MIIRYDHPNDSPNILTTANRYWVNTSTFESNTASPLIQKGHQSWSGDGYYHLHGGPRYSSMRARIFNEPYPSNLHVISNIQSIDISPCGKSGRWVLGPENYGQMVIADLWTGKGSILLKGTLSFLYNTSNFNYNAGSGLHDTDGKGSPDGTKVVFRSNYDLKSGPVTKINSIKNNTLYVESTSLFPENGVLSTNRGELISYSSKTANGFKIDSRAVLNTRERKVEINSLVSSFDHRVIPASQRHKIKLDSPFTYTDFPDSLILAYQKRPDLYFAIVKKPDQPTLRFDHNKVQLIPGENHAEIKGYKLLLDGRIISNKLYKPKNGLIYLEQSGNLSAIAVEFSGLESESSEPIYVTANTKLVVLKEIPYNFSFLYSKWYANDLELSKNEARKARFFQKETIHIKDGLLWKEWFGKYGRKLKEISYSDIGNPVRILDYQKRKMVKRTFLYNSGRIKSVEYFDDDGFITEQIFYRKEADEIHWWFQLGTPQKLIGKDLNGAPEGKGTYMNIDGVWTKLKENMRQSEPNESLRQQDTLKQYDAHAKYILFPNPGDGLYKLNNNIVSGPLNLSVYDLSGKLVHTEYNTNSELNIQHLENGIYTLFIDTYDGMPTSFKVVKK